MHVRGILVLSCCFSDCWRNSCIGACPSLPSNAVRRVLAAWFDLCCGYLRTWRFFLVCPLLGPLSTGVVSQLLSTLKEALRTDLLVLDQGHLQARDLADKKVGWLCAGSVGQRNYCSSCPHHFVPRPSAPEQAELGDHITLQMGRGAWWQAGMG